MTSMIRIGTAGWTIPRTYRDLFPPEGSQLQRYAARLSCVEINSSFHRPHRLATYQRWAESVPPDFSFAAKLPKEITHRRRLVDVGEPLRAFAGQTAGLGAKLRVVLVQIPPSLAFEPDAVGPFLDGLATLFPVQLVLEPRHPSWFTAAVDALLGEHRVARVAADPAVVSEAAVPGGWPGFAYFRFHGTPQVYRSSYDPAAIADQAAAVRRAAAASEIWVVYDNTTLGAATGNALALAGLLQPAASGKRASAAST